MLTVRSGRLRPKDLALLGMLMALQMVLSRVFIGNSFVQVGFGFIATVLLGYYFGSWWAGGASILTDLLMSWLWPNGTFFIGFTLSAFLAGFIYGVVLHNHKITIWRAILAAGIVTLLVNVTLNTLWVYMMFHTPFWPLFSGRFLKNLITWPINSAFIFVLLNASVLRSWTQRRV